MKPFGQLPAARQRSEVKRDSRHNEPGAVVGFSIGLFGVLALIVLACTGVMP